MVRLTTDELKARKCGKKIFVGNSCYLHYYDGMEIWCLEKKSNKWKLCELRIGENVVESEL